MSRSSSKARGLPQFTLIDPSLPAPGFEDFGVEPRRPSLPASPSPHVRNLSLDHRSTRTGLSRDASPHTHSRLPSLQMGPPFPESPGPATSKTITQSFVSSGSRPVSRGRIGPEDLLPPPPIGGSFSDRISSPTGSRASSLSRGGPDSVTLSSGPGSRTASPAGRATDGAPTKLNKKRTWLPGKSHARSESASARKEPWCFIVGTPEKHEYDLTAYINQQPVSELWDEQGDLYIHLFGDSQPPSFRLKASAIESSKGFQRLIGAELRSRDNSIVELDQRMRKISIGSNVSNSQFVRDGKTHLCIPLQFPNTSDLRAEDLENLVAVRNLFAFLVGQILVGTPRQPTLYAVFKNIAGLLSHYDFANSDGSTYGDVARANFLGYIEDLRLDDLRSSREKTLEAIVLGEMMKSWPLYNEGYIHAVGKWDDIHAMSTDIIKFILPSTRKRIEKSHMDLRNRLHAVESKLNDFEFPSLFQGIAASSGFQKVVDVKSWRASWVSMRRFTMNYYKNRYGAWPPKASSKKNDFEESGLNRLVLRELYNDFSDLYDMLVDKTNLTTRSADMAAHDEKLAEDPQLHWLRQLMSEFDRSSPPVKPPIPYDLCLLPDLKMIVRDFDSLPEKRQTKERARKLKSDEINLALIQSYDRDSMRATQFLESFMAYERNIYHGKNLGEIIDQRIGQWIFLYVVLQSLPLLVVDAPAVRWTEGVEYFLCEAPKGTPPWLKEDTSERRLYRVGDGAGIASLPADAVQNSVEGIYERSHCWDMAKIWSHGRAKMPVQAVSPTDNRGGALGRIVSDAFQDPSLSSNSIPAPPSLRQDWRSSSAGSSPRNSVALGLEELPLPPPIRTDVGVPGRKVSTPDINRTFDDILGSAATPTTGKKKGWGSFSG